MSDLTVSRRLADFTGRGYEKGRGRLVQAAWMLVSGTVFTRWWCPARVRVVILRAFGAEVGTGVLVRHRVRVHWPWKLSIGNDTWIGEGSWILNLEPVTIGSDVCVSQSVLLCTGSHDRRSPTFEFDNAPIWIDDGAWLAARSTVLRGTRVGRGAVVGAGALVTRDVPPFATALAPRAVISEPAPQSTPQRPAPGTEAAC
ncbi:DapH/DapD/GlmU-related protein [Cellulomonas sp. NS3]|uniref:DapH/DapD/GlmU-related protein n=1 Tax=Cellulomonas sp. NS3 TaxID=2973977 RepID=UPI0021639866|nr:DapH/DapD/GlmU-related protein [Cellulomonas sp. NS3]